MKKNIIATLSLVTAPVLAFGFQNLAGGDQAGSRDGGGLVENLDIVSILIGLVIGILIGYLIWGRKK